MMKEIQVIWHAVAFTLRQLQETKQVSRTVSNTRTL